MESNLPTIHKTHLMLLIEARDAQKRDIREILREAYEAGGGYEGAIRQLREQYDAEVRIGTLHGWFSEWNWSIQRVLLTPGLPTGRTCEGTHELAAA